MGHLPRVFSCHFACEDEDSRADDGPYAEGDQLEETNDGLQLDWAASLRDHVLHCCDLQRLAF